jgi:hypothetical protein
VSNGTNFEIMSKSEYQMTTSNSVLNNNPAKSEYHRASKASTTKETLTKEKATKSFLGNSSLQEPLNVIATKIFGSNEYLNPEISADQLRTQNTFWLKDEENAVAVRNFIALFERTCEKLKSQKANLNLSPSDLEQLETLIASRPSRDWSPIIRAFFTSEISYIVRRNHSLSAFLDSCHIFLVRHSPTNPVKPTPPGKLFAGHGTRLNRNTSSKSIYWPP